MTSAIKLLFFFFCPTWNCSCFLARKQEIIKVTEQLIEAINNGDFEAYTSVEHSDILPFVFCVKFIRSAIKSHPCLVAKFSGRYVILASRPSSLKPWGTWWRELTFTVSISRTVNMTDFLKCIQCSLSIWRFAFRFLSTSQISFIPISWEFCYVAVVYGKSFLISNIFMVKKTSFVHLEEINREIPALCCPRWLAHAS